VASCRRFADNSPALLCFVVQMSATDAVLGLVNQQVMMDRAAFNQLVAGLRGPVESSTAHQFFK